MYAGKQVQEWWAIVPCCEYHHRGGGLKKEFNQLVGLLRAASLNLPAGDWLMVPDELYKKYPRTDWDLMLNTLIKKVGAPGAQKARSKVMRSYGGKTSFSR